MALVKSVIFQIVGYQNSGKTTITTKLINMLKSHGLKIVTIKHHGHGGKLDISSQKDSSKHLEAGAYASIVEGAGQFILQAENTNLSLESQIKLAEFFKPEVILIEGHKDEQYTKLLLLRDESDLSLVSRVTNIKAIMVWNDELGKFIKEKTDYPCFSIHDEAAIEWMAESIMNFVHKIDENS